MSTVRMELFYWILVTRKLILMDTWPLGSTIFKMLGMATRVWGSVSCL